MRALAVLIAALTLALSAPLAVAQPTVPPLPANATVVASGLINPRGFTFAPDGALVVAEAGVVPAGFEAPGAPLPDFHSPTSRTGRVSRIDLMTGERTSLAEGLPSSVYFPGDSLGPANVAYLGSDLYVLIVAGPVHGWPFFASGVYRVNSDGTIRPFANIDAFNLRNPVANIPPDEEISDPYDMIEADGALWITDGNRNQVLKVTPDGTISRVVDFSQSHPVTTGIARAQDGRLIIVELTPVPFPQGAGRVHAIGTDGSVQMLARGTTAATGVAVAPDGTIYIVEHSASLGQPPFFAPSTGRVARMAGDGSLTTVAGDLMFPTIARIGPDGALYVAHFSVRGDDGQGQILRIDTAAQ